MMRRILYGGGLLLACVAIAAGELPSVCGAPVTFAFDAIVTDITDPGNLSGQLPFQPSIGDSITGLVAFTPVGFGQTIDNEAELNVIWKEEGFAASSLELRTNDNVFVAVGFDVQGPFDSLSIDCGINEQCSNSSSSVETFDVTYLGLGLSSGTDLIPTNDLIDSPALWNLFPGRRLLLTLAQSSGTGEFIVAADVGPMRLVPEPVSSVMLVCCGIFGVFKYCHRSR